MGEIRKASNLFAWVQDKAVLVLAAALFLVFPLVLHDGYFDITVTKFKFVFNIVILIGTIYACCWGLQQKRPDRSHWHWWDLLYVFFLGCGGISVFFSEWRAESFSGEAGRHNGLRIYLIYGIILIVIVSNHVFRLSVLIMLETAGTVVALLGICSHYSMDPLGVYGELTELQCTQFTSTMGHVGTMGAFMGMLFALSAGLLVFSEKWHSFAWHSIVCLIVSAGLISNEAEGAFLAVIMFFCIVPLLACKSMQMIRYCFAGLLFITSAFLLGLLDKVFTSAKEIGNINAFVEKPQAAIPGIFFFTMLLLLILFLSVKKVTVSRKGILILKVSFCILLAACVLVCILMFGMANWFTPEQVQGGMLERFVITDSMGNYRGYIWKKTLSYFSSLPAGKKLIGTGPDTTYQIYQRICTEPFLVDNNLYYNQAHNEYLQLLLTHGILGAASFFGWIGCSVFWIVQNGRKYPVYYAVALAVLAYGMTSLVNCSIVNTSAVAFALLCFGKCEYKENSEKFSLKMFENVKKYFE